MITDKQFEELRFYNGSWTIWNDTNDLKFFKSKQNQLHSNFIFLALNPSGKEQEGITKDDNQTKIYEFANFHKDRHKGDNNLKRCIQDKNLSSMIGSYITDLYLDKECNSGRIIKEKNEDEQERVKAMDRFFKQCEILGANNFNLICFGTAAFNYIISGLNIKRKNIDNQNNLKIVSHEFEKNNVKYNIKIFRVWHYSNQYNKSYSEIQLPDQLDVINKQMNKIEC